MVLNIKSLVRIHQQTQGPRFEAVLAPLQKSQILSKYDSWAALLTNTFQKSKEIKGQITVTVKNSDS